MSIDNAATPVKVRTLAVRHLTKYTYDNPIQRSVNRLHLRPFHDDKQRVLRHSIKVTPDVPLIEYEDVFGNWSSRFEITQPYTELHIEMEAELELHDFDPFAFAKLPIRPSYPLAWMPWERTMLEPYLNPVELPETQLKEIYDYAMSFVEANDYDLMESLFAMNLTLFRDFAYVPGSTHLETTPYEVLQNKKGVCQDFANLFLCMARLLNIPGRYVCGYVYTGNTGEQRAQSDASHAWLQLYIPNIGWKAFDPTNGKLPQIDHVRMAYGRHYRDATPTAGTLYSSANESMTVDVEVREIAQELRVNPVAAEPAPA